MTPIDFVVYDGDSDPNLPVHQVAEAMKEPVIIRGNGVEYEILSYYYDQEAMAMVLDIEEK